MLRRVSVFLLKTRGYKDDVKIKWIPPEHIPAYKPERSGDLEPAPEISKDSLGLKYNQCDEIKDAPCTVKKLFSVDFLGRQAYNALVKKEAMDRVRRHKYDDYTIETEIARITGHIRCLQSAMEEFPKNVRTKVTVQELIDRRKKFLNEMRKYDYKKFEWLLEKLNIEFKGFPESSQRKTRKESLRKLTEMYCEDIKNNKLANYRNLLESQQGPYLKQKLESLKFIRKEQIELNLPITVNEKEISNVQKQLEEWTIKDKIKTEAKKKKKMLVME